MQKPRLFAKLHRKRGGRAGLETQFLTRAYTALTMSVSLGSIEAAYFSYFIYDKKTALLHVLELRSDGFSSLS